MTFPNHFIGLLKPKGAGFCPQYQAVYDAYPTKPSDAVAAIWNTCVEIWVANGEWVTKDVICVYSAHTNSGGEAQLDWKHPVSGSDIVINGGFDTDSDWSKGTGWTISGGKAVGTAASGNLTQSGILTLGKTYKVTYTISDYSAGSIRFGCGTKYGTTKSANGTYSDELTYIAGSADLICDGVASFTGKIDNVSCVEWHGATIYNAPTFTVDEGVLFNGVNSYADQNFIPSYNGVNYVRDSASHILYIRTNIGTNTYHGIKASDDLKNMFICPYRAVGLVSYIQTNDNSFVSGANTDGSGMFINTRTAANVKKLYRNKAIIIDATNPSTGLPTHSFYTGCNNDDNAASAFRADQVSLFAAGAGMTQTHVNNFTDPFEVAMDALGKGVIT